MRIQHVGDMNEPLTATMPEVRRHLSDIIERVYRDRTPTFIIQEGKATAVLVDADAYRRLLRIERAAENAWLNRLADEAEQDGRENAISPEEMARELSERRG